MKLLNQLRSWIKKTFTDEYRVTVWVTQEIQEDPGGPKVIKKQERVYHFKKIIQNNNKYIKGITTDGMLIEISTVNPFDYEIVKLL